MRGWPNRSRTYSWVSYPSGGSFCTPLYEMGVDLSCIPLRVSYQAIHARQLKPTIAIGVNYKSSSSSGFCAPVMSFNIDVGCVKVSHYPNSELDIAWSADQNTFDMFMQKDENSCGYNIAMDIGLMCPSMSFDKTAMIYDGAPKSKGAIYDTVAQIELSDANITKTIQAATFDTHTLDDSTTIDDKKNDQCCKYVVDFTIKFPGPNTGLYNSDDFNVVDSVSCGSSTLNVTYSKLHFKGGLFVGASHHNMDENGA